MKLGAQFGQQQSLFDKETVPHFQDMPPHLQTREQFEASPGTWFHSSSSARLDSDNSRQPFHAGTQNAALDRAASDYPTSWDEVYGQPLAGQYSSDLERPWMHSYRRKGRMANSPETRMEDRTANYSSMRWDRRTTEKKQPGIYYENAVEDPGSTSIVVHGVKGNMTSHADFVKAAKRKGERVSPIAEAQSVIPSRVLHPEEFAEHGFEGSDNPYDREKSRARSRGQDALFDDDQYYA